MDEERREKMVTTLLTKEMTELPFLEVEPCINEVTLQVKLISTINEYKYFTDWLFAIKINGRIKEHQNWLDWHGCYG